MLARVSLPDFVAGVLFVGIGLTAALLATSNDLGTLRQTGAGFFPMAIGISLVAIGVAVIVFSLRDAPRRLTLSRSTLRPLLVILASPLLFAALIDGAGFPIAVFVCAAAGSLATVGTSRVEIAALSAALAAGSVFVFVYLLGQHLPVLGSWFS